MQKKNPHENTDPKESVKPDDKKPKVLQMTTTDLNDCIQHVGYTMEQLGYEK